MKLLWVCNTAPGMVQQHMGVNGGGGLWMDHMLSELARMPHICLRILCRGEKVCTGQISREISYRVFSEPAPHVYLPELECLFARELEEFRPDAIHSWGVEYGHTLALMNAAEKAGMAQKAAISIQGLCSVIALHYTEGIPHSVLKSTTFRDFLRRDNILQQQKKFQLRGAMEIQALQKASHVMGRTDWDRACTNRIHPGVRYHHCGETLREPFYQGRWHYASCKKHRIFASSSVYPIKGFHYLLEAFGGIVKRWPDAVLAVPGDSFLDCAGKKKLRQQTYHRYLAELARKYGVADRIEFLGNLSGEEMKRSYLDANVFVLSSTVENSPNSLGEAMLLGVPCVCADVGGVSSMLVHGKEGFSYQSTAAYMLEYYVETVFEMEDRAEDMGQAARLHALRTHDPETNLRQLLAVYGELAGQ